MDSRRPVTPSVRRTPTPTSGKIAPIKEYAKATIVLAEPLPTVAVPLAPAASAPVISVKKPATRATAAPKTSAVKRPTARPASGPVAKKPTPKPVPKRPSSGPSPRVPNRVGIHDAARPDAVRKRLDHLEAAAQTTAAPEALTARTLIGAVIVLLVAALLVPTLRGALEQGQVITAAKAHLAESQAKSEALDAELARWEDSVFIEAQARSRLSYVRPGDRVWRTVGGDTISDDVDPLTGVRVTLGVTGASTGQPWYEALLESFLVANGPIDSGEDDLNEILSRARN